MTLPARLQGCTFDAFRTTGLRGGVRLAEHLARCRRYVDSGPSSLYWQGQGLLFFGPTGTGKTHLAAAVLRCLKEGGARTAFASCPDLLARLAAAAGERSSSARITAPLLRADALLLDDLGARRPSPFVEDELLALIDHFYREALPLFVTTNYHPKDLGPRIGERSLSRLWEMCDKPFLDFTMADDYRRLTPKD